jgi:hypothetical protein
LWRRAHNGPKRRFPSLAEEWITRNFRDSVIVLLSLLTIQVHFQPRSTYALWDAAVFCTGALTGGGRLCSLSWAPSAGRSSVRLVTKQCTPRAPPAGGKGWQACRACMGGGGALTARCAAPWARRIHSHRTKGGRLPCQSKNWEEVYGWIMEEDPDKSLVGTPPAHTCTRDWTKLVAGHRGLRIGADRVARAATEHKIVTESWYFEGSVAFSVRLPPRDSVPAESVPGAQK